MKRSLSLVFLLGISLVGFIGCGDPPDNFDVKPGLPFTANWNKPRTISVDKNDQEEVAAVTEMEKDRSNYKYCLGVLAAYYSKIGDLDKRDWANSELKNVTEAKIFQWENVPEIVPPAGESLDNADERSLVERVVIARDKYIADTQAVAKLYDAKSDSYKAKVIRNLQARLDPIRLYPYFPDAMLPPKDLKGVQEDTRANALFEEAKTLFKEGKGPLHFMFTTSYPKERQACVKFMQLIHDYPQSTRVAMSAYYIAEINKEYFNENTLAVYWYECAWTWDPNLPEPAYFQAATVYDIRLHNYSKAVECYRLSLKHDPERWGNADFARGRIKDLGLKK